jgi:hypothetical protein
MKLFEVGRKERPHPRQLAREAIETLRAKREGLQSHITDVCGSPSETTNYAHLERVMEARKREL